MSRFDFVCAASQSWAVYEDIRAASETIRDDTIVEQIIPLREQAFYNLIEARASTIAGASCKMQAICMEFGERGTDLVPADLVAIVRDDLLRLDA